MSAADQVLKNGYFQPYLFRPELKGGVSVVRELHVYGSVVPVSARDPTKFQHQGFGMLLMEEAERIAKEEHGSVKISVISGSNISMQFLYKHINFAGVILLRQDGGNFH